jgi:ABC-type glycerol-3-phosphate transport system substrate-binding protein
VLRAGFSLRKTGFKPGTAEKWYTFLASAGGQPFSSDGTRVMLNTKAGREAIGFYEAVLFDRTIDAVGHDGDQQGFGQGRVAMFLREMHVIRWLEVNYPDIEFGVAPVPARDTSLSFGGSYVWSVSRDSPHQEAAWDWITFLMEDEAYTRYISIGGILPVMKSVASRPEFSEDPHMSVFLEQAVAAPYKFPGYARACDLLGAYIERFCYGRLDAAETLERAENDIAAVLAPNRTNGAPAGSDESTTSYYE